MLTGKIDEQPVAGEYLRDERLFVKPILRILQDNGGELAKISDLDNFICDYTNLTKEDLASSRISKSGSTWRPYIFKRNFAAINLREAGFIAYQRGSAVRLTEKGQKTDVDALDIQKDVYDLSAQYWQKKRKERQDQRGRKGDMQKNTEEDEIDEAEAGESVWRNEILDKVKALDPFDFESFFRGFLHKMGFEIDKERGIKRSGDAGLDGFAFCTDEQNLHTTSVAIQCKRFSDKPVSSHEIRELRGAINEHRAKYGIFVTTSYFSQEAIRSSREGDSIITLIDGDKLVDLMIQYNYKVQKEIIYHPDDKYFD